MQNIYHYSSPLGDIAIKSDGESLLGLWFDGQRFPASSDCVPPVVEEAKKWLDIYFSGRNPDFMPRLHIEGTPFQEKVWAILQTIPYGQTTTYGEIAKIIAKQRGIDQMSAQAVGNAVGQNPFPIIIPCHRVLGVKGKLVGYGGGLDRKVKLLKLEGIQITDS